MYSKTIGTKGVKCPRCGHDESYIKVWISDGTEFGECKSCGELTYHETVPKHPASKQHSQVMCPYCNSTNTIKISDFSKFSRVAVFGIFGLGKATKEWHCNECKSDF